MVYGKNQIQEQINSLEKTKERYKEILEKTKALNLKSSSVFWEKEIDAVDREINYYKRLSHR